MMHARRCRMIRLWSLCLGCFLGLGVQESWSLSIKPTSAKVAAAPVKARIRSTKKRITFHRMGIEVFYERVFDLRSKRFGYAEVRFQIIHHDARSKIGQSVRVSLSNRSYGGAETRVSREVFLQPGAQSQFSLRYPQFVDLRRLNISIDQGTRNHTAYLRSPFFLNRKKRMVLIGEDVPATFEKLYSRTGFNVRKNSIRCSVMEWSTHPGSYHFDAIILTAKEFRQMPNGVRQALLQVVEQGGLLLHLGQLKCPSVWAQTESTSEDISRMLAQTHGKTHLSRTAHSKWRTFLRFAQDKHQQHRWRLFFPGAGVLISIPKASMQMDMRKRLTSVPVFPYALQRKDTASLHWLGDQGVRP
ncbi:MAG: hypothetical protein AAGJ35_04970, partial [Myxococcota bacterium]